MKFAVYFEVSNSYLIIKPIPTDQNLFLNISWSYTNVSEIMSGKTIQRQYDFLYFTELSAVKTSLREVCGSVKVYVLFLSHQDSRSSSTWFQTRTMNPT